MVIGSAIPVGQNWDAGSSNNSTVGDGTYIGLFILMIIGSFFGLILYPWHKMVREDGTRVLNSSQQSTLKEELMWSWIVVKTQIWIILFWPYCWAINYYNVYQNNLYNSPVFSVRGRALNSLLSGIVQIPAAFILSLFTDYLPFKRRARALCGALYIFILFNSVWIGGYFAMRETKSGLSEAEKIDVFDPGYGQRCFLYVMYGFMDATYNCFAFWLMGSLSNEPRVVSRTSNVLILCSIRVYLFVIFTGLGIRLYVQNLQFGLPNLCLRTRLEELFQRIHVWNKLGRESLPPYV